MPRKKKQSSEAAVREIRRRAGGLEESRTRGFAKSGFRLTVPLSRLVAGYAWGCWAVATPVGGRPQPLERRHHTPLRLLRRRRLAQRD